MTKCLNQGCEKEVISVAGRRPRQFCSNNCRQKDWQRKQKEKLLEPYVETGEVITRTIQTSTEVFKPKAALKPEKQPDVPQKEEKAVEPPKSQPQKHPLWKQGDPKENSGAFFLKYDCNNYEELSKLKNKS